MKLRVALSMAILAAFLLPPREAAAQATTNADSSSQDIKSDDLPPLPLSSGRSLDLLPPPPQSQTSSRFSCVQWPSGTPSDCRSLQQRRRRRSHAQQLQETLQVLQSDKKHGVHVYLANMSQAHGRLTRIGDESFAIRTAKGKPEIELAYKDVSWVTKEPTGREKFGRGLEITGAMILLAPLIILLALLFAAGGGDC